LIVTIAPEGPTPAIRPAIAARASCCSRGLIVVSTRRPPCLTFFAPNSLISSSLT
jgi:hypothetical protein